MAYTERYVTDAAGGGGDGTSGDPWTLAEALTNGTAADRINIQSDSGYSIGADVVSGTGTAAQLLCFRGYNSSIGDLENQGWNSDATLNTTNFPVITCTGIFDTGAARNAFLLFQNLVFTGALSSELVGGGSADNCYFVECKITNTQNNTSAVALQLDNACGLINCDLECSGAAHGNVLLWDNNAKAIGCRFKGVDAGVALVTGAGGLSVVSCLLQGASAAGIGINFESSANAQLCMGNTFYDLERCIAFPNGAPSLMTFIINNHATDCTEYINNLYSGTANYAVIEVNNRTRDNTTPRTGIGDGANIGEVTTDTGGDTTDYTNPGSNDFTLITGAPGVEAGMRQHTDIGAYQRLSGLIVGSAWLAASIMGRYIADIVRR